MFDVILRILRVIVTVAGLVSVDVLLLLFFWFFSCCAQEQHSLPRLNHRYRRLRTATKKKFMEACHKANMADIERNKWYSVAVILYATLMLEGEKYFGDDDFR